jgi:hypothetical protein
LRQGKAWVIDGIHQILPSLINEAGGTGDIHLLRKRRGGTKPGNPGKQKAAMQKPLHY